MDLHVAGFDALPGTHHKIRTATSLGFQFSSRFSFSSCSAAARANGKSPFSHGRQAGRAGEDTVVSHRWLVCAWEASKANPPGPAEHLLWLSLRQRRLSKDRSISMRVQPSPDRGSGKASPLPHHLPDTLVLSTLLWSVTDQITLSFIFSACRTPVLGATENEAPKGGWQPAQLEV